MGEGMEGLWLVKRVELVDFIALSFVLAFIFSFNEWGVEQFDFIQGVRNLGISFVFALASIFVHNFFQRLEAVRRGLVIEQRVWWWGVLFAVIVAFVSYGRVPLLIGTFFLLSEGVSRLGRGEITLKDYGGVGLVGAIASIAFAVVIKLLYNVGFFGNEVLVNKIFLFNILFAFFSMLPIPPLDGSKVFLAYPLWYVFVFTTIVAYWIIGVAFDFFSVFLALVLGVIAMIGAHFVMFQK
jgi:Zn-dependent protease